MKLLRFFALITAVGGFSSCSEKESSETEKKVAVSGEVFITTRGGDTIKISGEEVLFFTRETVQNAYDESLESAPHDMPRYDETMTKYVKLVKEFDSLTREFAGRKRDEMSAQAQSCRDHIRELEYAKSEWPHASYIFTFFPDAEFRSMTDSDGRFSISLPPGDWIAVVESRRAIGSSEERYYWAVPTDSKNTLLLTNQNMVTASNDDSAINANVGYFKHE